MICTSKRLNRRKTSRFLDESAADVAHHQPVLEAIRIVERIALLVHLADGADGEDGRVPRLQSQLAVELEGEVNRCATGGACPHPVNQAGPGRLGTGPLRAEARIRPR